MPFPTTSIISSCAIPNEDPFSDGGLWSGPIFAGDNQFRIVSDQCVEQSGVSFAGNYTTGTYGADQEIYCTIPVIGTTSPFLNLYLRVTGAGTSGLSGYVLQYLTGSDFKIHRCDNETLNQLGAAITQAFSAGDKLGFSVVGDTLSAFRYTSGAWVETPFATRTDSTYTGGGNLGIEGGRDSWALTDIGGGTVVGSSPTLDQLAYRYRNDDGSESGATFAAALNTPLTMAKNSPIRVRTQLDATDDVAAMQFRQEYRRKRASKPDPWKVLL